VLVSWRLDQGVSGPEGEDISARVSSFVRENLETARAVYDSASVEETSTPALLFQPEALMLWERLSVDETSMRATWNQEFPEEELQRLANAFGLSFDSSQLEPGFMRERTVPVQHLILRARARRVRHP